MASGRRRPGGIRPSFVDGHRSFFNIRRKRRRAVEAILRDDPGPIDEYIANSNQHFAKYLELRDSLLPDGAALARTRRSGADGMVMVPRLDTISRQAKHEHSPVVCWHNNLAVHGDGPVELGMQKVPRPVLAIP